MELFSHRGKHVEFWTITGEVLGSEKYSETHVTSSGGGGHVSGYVGPNGGTVGGHVDAPVISSQSVTNHDFWIRTVEGLEKDIQLKGVDIPLRVGQKITLVSAGLKGKNKRWYTMLVNHNAGKRWLINSPEELNQKLSLEIMTGKSLVIGIVLGVGGAYLAGDDVIQLGQYGIHTYLIPVAGATCFVIYRYFLKKVRFSRLLKQLRAHLDKLAENVYRTQ